MMHHTTTATNEPMNACQTDLEEPTPFSLRRTHTAQNRTARVLSDIAVRDEAKEMRPDAKSRPRKNRRGICWNTTLRIFSGREQRSRWLRIESLPQSKGECRTDSYC